MCLRKPADSPDFQACAPLQCGNAVFSKEDIKAWRDRANGLMQISRDETLAPRVRASAADHAEQLTKFFDALETKA